MNFRPLCFYTLVQWNVHPTCSHANKTGAVARPSCRSVAVGFPISLSVAMKSRMSSTTYNGKKSRKIKLPVFLLESRLGARKGAISKDYAARTWSLRELVAKSSCQLTVNCVNKGRASPLFDLVAGQNNTLLSSKSNKRPTWNAIPIFLPYW